MRIVTQRTTTAWHRASRTIVLAGVLAVAIGLLLATTIPIRAQGVTSLLVKVEGAIGVGVHLKVKEAMAAAKSKQAHLLIIRLDTPGGLVASTREIISEILNSPVPVAVYVAPSGARAASAGTYIAYASHIVAMAPGTHLGAATPIPVGAPGVPGAPPPNQPERKGDGKPDLSPAEAMQKKVLNDAVAYIRSLAELRGRNAEWAEKAVREADTLTAKRALKENVVEIVAQDLPDLLRQFDGRTVTTLAGDRILKTTGTTVTVFEPSWKSRVLTVITDPNVAFILLMIGIYGILFEFWSPGLAGPGIIGAICLLVALTALSMLPVTAAGLALLLLGILLMVAESFAPGFGILGLGGIVAFVAGGLFLFDPAAADIDFAVAWPVVLAVAATTALLFAGLLGIVMTSRRKAVVTGSEELVGSLGSVISWQGSCGRVRVHGEIWAAESKTSSKVGARVRVVGRKGLTLDVVPAPERSS